MFAKLSDMDMTLTVPWTVHSRRHLQDSAKNPFFIHKTFVLYI